MRVADETESGLEAILAEHSGAVFSFALRLVADHAAAEEIAQDVFVTLWRTAPPLMTDAHRRHWLLRTTAHRAADRHRRIARRPVLVIDESLEDAPGHASAQLPFALETQLDELVRSLPEGLRTALVLRYGEGDLTPEEIAELLHQPVATVKSNLQRGLALLRRKAAVRLKEYVRHG